MGEAKEKIKKEFDEMRNEYEMNHLGDYEMIFPLLGMDDERRLKY